jgi:hypothetical protein
MYWLPHSASEEGEKEEEAVEVEVVVEASRVD